MLSLLRRGSFFFFRLKVLEGVGRSLDPNLDLLKAAGPYIVGAVEGRVKFAVYEKMLSFYHRIMGHSTHPGADDEAHWL